MVFLRDVFVANSERIIEDVKEMLLKIQEEATLVEQDNLAKGQLIETAQASAQLTQRNNSKEWSTNVDALRCAFREDDPAEYWGDVGLYHSDFIAGTSKYPWMPSSISDKDGFLD
jgi:hypothetical protein